ncbi:hypothetical protein CUN63_29725 [Pseudomonas sp. ACM7]|nr:hypothetical protein CUN63_29725 [Pseudomonas sp. ACM7]
MGASLLAIAAGQPTLMLNVPLSSRASSLPQGQTPSPLENEKAAGHVPCTLDLRQRQLIANTRSLPPDLLRRVWVSVRSAAR